MQACHIWQEQQQTVLSGRDPCCPGLRNLKCRLASLGLMVAKTCFHSQKDQGQEGPIFYNYFNQEYDITLYYIYRNIYIKTIYIYTYIYIYIYTYIYIYIYIYITNYLQPNLGDSWWNRPRFSWHPQGNHRAFDAGGWKWHLEVISGGIGDGLYWL